MDSSSDPVLSVSIPLRLDAPPPTKIPPSKFPVSFSITYTKSTPEAVVALRWALENGRAVDLDVQYDISEGETSWESLEDLLTKATDDSLKDTPIVLCVFQALYHS